MPALATAEIASLSPRRAGLKRLGARVWDAAGRARLDFDMGGGSVLLGYGEPAVETAVASGVSAERHAACAADALAELAPCAEAVRFCAEESQALPAAIAAARRITGNPRAVVYEEHGSPIVLHDLAAIVVDAMGASAEHLASAARLADGSGALLIFDEGVSSFRVHERGAQGESGVVPHLSVFGAAIANGRPLGAIAGQAALVEAVDPADLPDARGDSLAAAAATLQRLIEAPIARGLALKGGMLQREVRALADAAGASRFFELDGDPSLPIPTFALPHLEGLWMRQCSNAGLICVAAHGLSAAHDEADIAVLVEAYRAVLPALAARGAADLLGRGMGRQANFVTGL